jgi:type II secretory pathway pseudopilin PulG
VKRTGHDNRSERGRAGFTLVELLVALAIFITVMAIVALVFSAAVRTTKQGAQNQEAFELARAAMRLFERDLSRAFTNRDHGDVYSFYGTPIGFTYVGMIAVDGQDAYNLARVTYVIYHNSLNQLTGAVGQYETVDGAIVPTYNLLRYVEPGVDNLDAYESPWTTTASLDSNNPTLEDLVQRNVFEANCGTDLACQEVVERTARREIWIRMLAGGDTDVPSAWDELDLFLDRGLRPDDFVIGENIRFLSADGVQCAATSSALESLLEANGTPLDFDDLLFTDAIGNVCARLIGDVNSTPIFLPFDPVVDRFAAIPSPNSGPQPYFNYWDMGVIRGDLTTTADDKVTPLAYTFWNDARNLVSDGLDNDADGTVDEPDEQYGVNVGSPLDARLPLAVTVDFTLFFPSVYPGAPDFNQRFTQRIDLPTGSRRAFKTTAPGP